ncbi:MAG TPA: dihydroorotate dehydrogenase-like protein [Chloroflexia bacterium]|nr:dihydroorotate dehydrogenase-like protein [Chloroflexia bacterium]
MKLDTTYLGLELRTPLVPSASPMSEDVDNIKRMEDAGASAVVLHSLFEEQIEKERHDLHFHMTEYTDTFAEALSFFPEPSEFRVGPEDYLDHIYRAKESVGIPIIASLNGTSAGGWTDYASRIQQAGADAIELNIFYIPNDINMPAAEVEQTYVDIVASVRRVVSVPVSVKLGPFFSSMAHMASRLHEAGANGLVLFNRFYQPDIDLNRLEVRPHILLSTPQALRLPLRWIAMLYGRVGCDMAASGGIHTGPDAIKMIMAGASVTMLCSALLKRGIPYIRTVEQQMLDWMEEFEYESVGEMRGSMSQRNSPDPAAFERAQYVRALQSFRRPVRT